VTCSKYNTPSEPLFAQQILPFDKIILQSNLALMHSIHYEYAPPALHKLWPKNNTRSIEYELRNANCYALPRVKYAMFQKFPAYNLTKLWNDYQGTSKLHDNKLTFTLELKKELLSGLNFNLMPPPPLSPAFPLPFPSPSSSPPLPHPLPPLSHRAGPL